MLKRRWPVLLGPPLILLAVAALALRGETNVKAARTVTIPRFAACTSAAEAKVGTAHPGTWWRTTDRLDSAGSIIARRLYVGRGASAKARADLPVESSVSGPIDGLVVVASDDGSHSLVRLVSVAGLCEVVVDERSDVVRGAILDPHDGAVFAHVVGRETRADLGTFRISQTSGGASEARVVAPPLAADLAAAVGMVYGTGLRLDPAGTHLAVQSCTDLGCLTRVFDLADPRVAPLVVRGGNQGPLLGFAGTDLVTWAACDGYPCPLLAWDVATSDSRQLAPNGTAAALTADGRRLVALLGTAGGTRLVEVDTASGRSTFLRGLPAGQRPLGGGASSVIGLEVADDEVAMANPGGDAIALRPDSVAEEALP
jgi:hypothetical protein